ITWVDDNTLKIEADAGKQTRVLHFSSAPPPKEAPSLQGYSSAEWVFALGGRAGRGGEGQPGAASQRGGSLKVTTTNLKPGYLRKNGAPYSASAIVTDPTYLNRPFVTSTNLRKQNDASGWAPSACEAR